MVEIGIYGVHLLSKNGDDASLQLKVGHHQLGIEYMMKPVYYFG
jgi:hypothetical protein